MSLYPSAVASCLVRLTNPFQLSPSRTRGAPRLKSGHLWVYRSDLAKAGDVAPGALVHVQDERGRKLGSALYSSSSQIAIRLLTAKIIGED